MEHAGISEHSILEWECYHSPRPSWSGGKPPFPAHLSSSGHHHRHSVLFLFLTLGLSWEKETETEAQLAYVTLTWFAQAIKGLSCQGWRELRAERQPQPTSVCREPGTRTHGHGEW